MSSTGRLTGVDALVRTALAVGELELSDATAEDRLAIIRQRRREAHTAALVAHDAEQAVHQRRLDLVTGALNDRQAVRVARDPRGDALRTAMEPWVAAGLMQRMTTIHVSRPVRFLIGLFLAALDWFVFARAAAVALDIQIDARNVEYWLGGSFGMLVFLIGFVTARSWKQVRLAYAQRGLGVPAGAVAASPPFAEAMGSTVLFVLLCFASALVRVEAPGGERQSVVLFQLLVPVVLVAVEFFLHDPIAHRVPHPRSPVEWWLRRAQRRAQAAFDSLPSFVDIAAEIDAHFDHAEARLAIELRDRGFR